jgi:hypothetical protein
VKPKFAASLFALAFMSVQAEPVMPSVFIAPMEGNLDGFIAAEIVQQHVPVKVVTEEKDAQLVLVGACVTADDKWYNVPVNNFKDKSEGNIRLLDVKSKTMVWAGEAGDHSLKAGAFRSGGQRKVAARIAGKMKKDYFHVSAKASRLSLFPEFESAKRIFNF